MGSSLRAILFNADPEYAPVLRQSLFQIPSLRIVAELDVCSLLLEAVPRFPADVLIAHLDPDAGGLLAVLEQVSAAHPELPILAISGQTQGEVLLQAMRVGLKRYLVKPLKEDELREVLDQVGREQSASRQPGKLISVMGSAGGVGGTFLATNLAVELADLVGPDEKVALLDFDFRFGQVATMLDVTPQFTVADLCATPEQPEPAMIEKALVRHGSGVCVLARPPTFQQAEDITAAHCAAMLSTLQEVCAYVVVDGPVRSDPGGRAVLDAADCVFLVLQLLVTSVRNADRMLQELASGGFNTERVRLLCNRVGRESSHLTLEQVEETLQQKLFHVVPDDWKTVSAAINMGHSLASAFARTKVRQAVRELAVKLHAPPAASTNGQSLLKRIFKAKGGAEAAGRGAAAKVVAGAGAG